MAEMIRRNEVGEQSPVAWEPFRLMRELMSWDPFAELMPSALFRRGLEGFAPRFDVKETRDAYVFTADLPGVTEDDLDVSLTGNRLTVSGKRESERTNEGERYYAYERSYGSFTRSFTLPEGVDAEHVDATLKNGVLTLSVPKKEAHKPRKISIKGVAEKIKGALGGKEKGQA